MLHDKELQKAIDAIQTGITTSAKNDLNLMIGWLQGIEKRISALESSRKQTIYNILNLILQFLQPIAILILAYVISKISK